jgi:Tol biopolymer transport system component
VRWLIGSLQGLAGTVPSWREDRLACLKSQKEFFADKYTSATNLIGIHFGSVDAGTAQLQPTVTSSSLLEELEFDFAKANRYLIRNPIIFSNDGYHVAFVMSSEDNKKKVFVDGKSVPVAYDDISKETPIFSQDGHHIAYEAKKDNKWLVVRDSQEGQNYDSIDSLTFSPDGNRIAYKARKINGYIKIFYSKTPVPNYLHFVVIDNQEGPKYHRIEDLRFSPDGKHLAYVAYRDYDHSIIVVDGEEKGSWYDDILYYIFSPDGKRIAYYARKDNNMLLVVDGQESQKYFYDTSILEDCKFNFSPDSKHLAYIANRDLFHSVLIVDGQEKGLEYDSVYDFTFSSDGKRMAYAGRKGAENHVVVDGHEGPRYDGVKICNIKFSPDGKRVTYSLDTIADRVFVVVDDQKGQEYRWVDAPIFSPDGKRMAYAAQTRKGAEDIVVVDGQEGAVYEHINFHGFSPNGKLLYRAQKNKKGFLVVDGHEGHEYDHINPPIFSRDGKHIAYEASNGKKWYVNLDNYEVAECMGRGIKFRSDGRLAYLCRKDDHVSVKYLLPAER